MDPLSSIRSVAPVEPLGSPSLSPKTGMTGFPQLFAQAVERVEAAHQDSQQKIDKLLRGEDQELHEVALSAQRAEVSLEYFMQVRNKVVQAYQEIMRMQM